MALHIHIFKHTMCEKQKVNIVKQLSNRIKNEILFQFVET